MNTTTFKNPVSQEQFRKSFIEALTGYKITEITAVNDVNNDFPFLVQHGVLLDAELADETHTKCHIAIQMHPPRMCERYIRCVQSDIDCRTMRLAEWDEGEYITHKSCVALIKCENSGVMEEFLRKNGSEVRNVLFEEWNQEEAERIAREEACEKTTRQHVLSLKGIVAPSVLADKFGIGVETVLSIWNNTASAT